MSIPNHLATFHPAKGDSIERSFPSDSQATDWLRIQCPTAEFEHDAKTDRWTAWHPEGRLVGEVSRQRAG